MPPKLSGPMRRLQDRLLGSAVFKKSIAPQIAASNDGQLPVLEIALSPMMRALIDNNLENLEENDDPQDQSPRSRSPAQVAADKRYLKKLSPGQIIQDRKRRADAELGRRKRNQSVQSRIRRGEQDDLSRAFQALIDSVSSDDEEEENGPLEEFMLDAEDRLGAPETTLTLNDATGFWENEQEVLNSDTHASPLVY